MTPDRWFDLALNLFSEIFGIVVTVFLVDWIIKRREEKRWKPSKYVVFSRIIRLTSKVLRDLYPLSTPVKSDYVIYGFDKVLSGKISDLTNVDLSTGNLASAIKNLVAGFDKEKFLEKRENLLETRDELSKMINDSGFFLEPELLSLVLTLDNEIDRVAYQLSQLGHLSKIIRLPTESLMAYEILRLFITTQNLQKWLVAQSTESISEEEYWKEVFQK